MRALVVPEPGQSRIDNVPEPQINDYQALVRVKAASICNSTDTQILTGRFPMDWLDGQRYPGILGHEGVGEVVKTGSKVSAFKEGDHVFRPRAEVEGLGCFFGSFAEFGVVTDYQALLRDHPGAPVHFNWPMQQVIPAGIDPYLAPVLINLKECYSALRNIGVRWESTVLVMGTGGVGLGFAHMAKLHGVRNVISVGRRDERLEMARQFGADHTINTRTENLRERVLELTDGKGADFIIEATGDASLYVELCRLLATDGKLGVYGINNLQEFPLSMRHMPPSFWFGCLAPDEPAAHKSMMDFTRLGIVKPEQYATDFVSLAEAPEAFSRVKDTDVVKIVIRIDE
ncbi:MAG: sorbitol dehydrogenase [Armatimonadetes bacterium]|nr:sorbitol dehydrogenase [Armatimonadota bacterium]